MTLIENAAKPVVRISKGHFTADKLDEVKRLIAQSATPLVPAIQVLPGLLYYHPAVDEVTNTVVNVSIWVDAKSAHQMENLAAMLAQRPVMEDAGVKFDKIANYEPLWKIEGPWSFNQRTKSVLRSPNRDSTGIASHLA